MQLKDEIIDILKRDGRLANRELAGMTGADEAEVAQIVRELEEDGVILGYAALVNTELHEDAPAEAMIELKVTPQREFGYNEIARRVYMFPEVKAVFLMSGRYDLAVRVEAPTMKAISQFVWEKLSVLEGVSSTETLFIMRKYKEFGQLLLKQEPEDRLVVTP